MRTMLMLLLVSCAALLVSPASVTQSRLERQAKHSKKILDSLYDQVENYKPHSSDVFVEDVQNLVEAGCKNEFFCKVDDILQAHHNMTRCNAEAGIRRTLASYIKDFDCPALLVDVPKAEVGILMNDLMEKLKICIWKRNYKEGISNQD